MKTSLIILVVMAAVFGSGCGGLTASKSVSPLDFILPGLMYHTPPPAPPDPGATNGASLLAGSSSFLPLPMSAFSRTDQIYPAQVNQSERSI